jgi:hypothetical protein
VGWLARHVRDVMALRAVLQGSAVGFLLGAAVTLYGLQAGLLNALAWSTVAIYGLLLAGAIHCLRSPAKRGAAL